MKQKKIVILTWTGVYNFGTALQSYALQHALELQGVHVQIMDKIKHESCIKSWIKEKKELLKFLFENKETRAHKMKRFHRSFQKILRPNIQQLHKVVNDTDVFISGSDQIWNTAHRYSPMMFLDFADGKKRVSYATSIGTETILPQYKEIVKKHLLKYQYIAVREETARVALSQLTQRSDIVTVVDPTFLLTADNWLRFASFSHLNVQLSKPYILCYLIGKNTYYQKQIKDIMKRSGINDIVIIPLKKTSSVKIKNAIIIENADPHDFVYLIKNATLVCTDSFHATAISINLSKQFVELLRFKDTEQSSQNSRIYNLLNHYNLNNYLYQEDSNKWLETIDYKKVHKILESDRDFSLTYLKKAISE